MKASKFELLQTKVQDKYLLFVGMNIFSLGRVPVSCPVEVVVLSVGEIYNLFFEILKQGHVPCMCRAHASKQ